MGMKRVKTNMRRGAFALLLCSLFVSSLQGVSHAATPAPTAVTNNTNTLKISPLRTDITINAGETGVVKTFVTNITGKAIAIHPIENDFVSGDEKGTPSIILDENSYAPTHSLKRFMVPLKDVTIAPNETKQIEVSIAVPKTAQPGGYYGAVRFAPVSTGGSSQVNLNASAASLILMTVPGATTEKLVMTNFDVQQDGGKGSNFRTPNNLSLLLRFQNKGNVQESPFGQIYVKKGNKVVYTYNFNQNNPKDTILPDSSRRWEVPIKNIGKFGKYTVGGTFTYGTKNQSIQVTKTIWIIPTTYILGAIGAVVLIVLLIVGIVFGLRRYKQKLVKTSRRRHY
jgi:hypothetical protein